MLHSVDYLFSIGIYVNVTNSTVPFFTRKYFILRKNNILSPKMYHFEMVLQY